jgi:feruloyl esterase
MYHGWNDQLVPPLSSVNYYSKIVTLMGGEERAAASVRLFMMPGMNHCRAGEGPNTFDKMDVLERWVEKGQSPNRITASHSTDGKVDRTRPLCPFPQVATHTGNGSIDDEANFVCRLP